MRTKVRTNFLNDKNFDEELSDNNIEDDSEIE